MSTTPTPRELLANLMGIYKEAGIDVSEPKAFLDETMDSGLGRVRDFLDETVERQTLCSTETLLEAQKAQELAAQAAEIRTELDNQPGLAFMK